MELPRAEIIPSSVPGKNNSLGRGVHNTFLRVLVGLRIKCVAWLMMRFLLYCIHRSICIKLFHSHGGVYHAFPLVMDGHTEGGKRTRTCIFWRLLSSLLNTYFLTTIIFFSSHNYMVVWSHKTVKGKNVCVKVENGTMLWSITTF